MPRDVFISHSAQDKKIAEAICTALEEAAIRCWVAPRDVRPGRSFPGEITRAIQQSKVMLLLFSRHSNASEQVLREVQLAVDCRVPIVRLRLQDIPLSDDLRYYLSTPHWLDALTPPISKHMPPLVAAVKELLGLVPDEAGAPAATAASPPVAATPVSASQEARPTETTSSKNPQAIVWAVVVLAALGFAMWARSTKKAEPKAAPTPVALRSPDNTTPAVTPSATPVVAVTSPTPPLASPSPTVPEKTETPPPKPSPSPTAVANSKAPSARNGRAWQQWIDEFVHNFIASNESNDLDLAISFYAPNVELFEEGKKSIDAIRRDIEGYNARWPSRRATIRGDVRMSEKAANRSYTASFEHDYYVENAGRGEWINGAVAVDLQIIIGPEGLPQIVSMKQKTLRKDKGTMQRR